MKRIPRWMFSSNWTKYTSARASVRAGDLTHFQLYRWLVRVHWPRRVRYGWLWLRRVTWKPNLKIVNRWFVFHLMSDWSVYVLPRRHCTRQYRCSWILRIPLTGWWKRTIPNRFFYYQTTGPSPYRAVWHVLVGQE